MSDARRVVIVGGGIAGWTVATSLRDGGFDGEITIVEREAACYDRPPLSKSVLVAPVPLDELAFGDAATIAAHALDLRCGRTAVRLDAAARSVELDDGTLLRGDAVVLATGADARAAAFPGAALPGVQTMRTYADAVAARRLVGKTVAVLGGGLLGAEAAAALRLAGSEVVLIDSHDVPGARCFGVTMAAHLHAMHAANGVDVRVDRIAQVAPADGALLVTLAGGDTLVVDGVLVGTGVTIDTALAAQAGLEVDGGIVVDGEGRTSAPGVFAAGDATRRRTDAGLSPARGHWDAAGRDARAVAAAILGTAAEPRGAEWFWSDRYGHHVEVVGDMAAPGAHEVVRPGPHPTVFLVDGDTLVGAASVDDPMAVRAARRLIERAVPVSSDMLADADIPLRSLLPRTAPTLSSS